MFKIILKNLLYLLILLVLSFALYKPLLNDGFYPMHDDTQPARIFVMAQELRNGQFPVRWVADLGYGFGYPLFNFYAPLPYYLGAIFYLIHIDLITATKIMFFIGIIISLVFMFYLGKEVVNSWVGIVAAVLYAYTPYHAVNIYVRGAVGEYYAYGFLPLLILGFWKIFTGKGQRTGIIITGISLAVILLSHNILGLITITFSVLLFAVYLIYITINKDYKNILLSLILSLTVGLGLSSFFILPAIFETRYTNIAELTTQGSDFRQHFIYLDQLWDSPWGYAGSAPRRADGMSFKIGKIYLIFTLVSVISLFFRRKKIDKKITYLVISMISIFILTVFFMTDLSSPVYLNLPFFRFIQYPWRFLNFTLLSLSILIISSFHNLKKQKQIIAGITVILITMLINTKYFNPQKMIVVQENNYLSNENLRFTVSKISDEYLPDDFDIPKTAENIALAPLSTSEKLKVVKIKDAGIEKILHIDVSEPSEVTTNIAFFPGWLGFLDGQRIVLMKNHGRLAVDLPSGYHVLRFKFSNTPIRSIANSISLFSLVLLLYLSIERKRVRIWLKEKLR